MESTEDNGSPPALDYEHITLRSVILPNTASYILSDSLNSFIADQVVQYCVGIDFYEFMTAAMSQKYKFDHWTGEEIYPDEGNDYLEMAGSLECYYFKQVQQNKSDKVPMQIVIDRKQEWQQSEGKLNLYDEEDEVHQRNTKQLRVEIEKRLNEYFCRLFDCKMSFDFGFSNNYGATWKYGIIHAHSEKLTLFDNDEKNMFITLYATSNASRDKNWKYDLFAVDPLIFDIKAVVFADDQWCQIDMPFYM